MNMDLSIWQADLNLPEPSTADYQRSLQLYQQIKNSIIANGPIPFIEFMERALFAPDLGYYNSSKTPFGKRGDFITAPEISPLFAEVIANYYQNITEVLENDNILEFGAGSGQLAYNFLKTYPAEQAPNYYIIEKANARRNQQQQLLQELLDQDYKIFWLDTIPENFSGLIIANEVLDAFACELIKYDDSWQRAYVEIGKQQQLQTTWQNIPDSKLFRNEIAWIKKYLPNVPNYYLTEFNPQLDNWLQSITNKCSSCVLLIIDYGFPAQEYYHHDRQQGTLMCHYQHHSHTNPYILPGLQDLTCHVDMTRLTLAAQNSDFDIIGYNTQAGFLINAGILDLAAKLPHSAQLAKQLRTLLMPEEMGEFFKVIAFSKGNVKNNFAFGQDLRHKLY